MENPFFSFALTLFLLNLFRLCSTNTNFNYSTDKNSLLDFKNTFDLDPNSSILIKNWSTNTSICSWSGVSCGQRHQRVTALNVSGFGLRGTLAPHLGNLTFLRSLDISSNNFSGFLPSQISNLRRLRTINTGFNNFTGEIPSWLGSLPELQEIHLNNNTFSGEIPLSFFNVSSLKSLDFGNNFLDGDIPKEISNFSLLQTLNLEGNLFTGSIPYGIFNISSLIEINLRNNGLYGELPSYMCSSTNSKLKIIILSNNEFFGGIPPTIRNCRELEELWLLNNKLNGSISNEIGNLRRLRVLSLSLNRLTGPIPKEVGNLTSLEILGLSSNQLEGELPEELGKLASLEVFLAAFNDHLNGSIPSSIFNISTLKRLSLQQNLFSGTLPPDLGISLPNIHQLSLFFNRLTGRIPSSINNASKLVQLELNRNSFTGSVPDMSNLRFLETLYLWENNLTGAEFLPSLTNSPSLKSLIMSNNPLMRGTLPSSLGNFSTSLQFFMASFCDLSGAIPSEIGNLTSLLYLHLSDNRLTGFVPTTIRNLTQLQKLYLSSNQLEGHNIFPDLCQLRELGELNLSSNLLTGPIHECLGELQSLRRLSLASNELNSTIPLSFWSLTDLVYLELNSNSLSGQLSPQVGNLKALDILNLSSNQFSGDIPTAIQSCESLTALYLSDNKFGGSIPESLGNIPSLIAIFLSNNTLSGSIPKSLERLEYLQFFNVSYNRLEGEIPSKGCFVNFTADSFASNLALCGETRFEVPPCPKNSKGNGRLVKYLVPPLVSVFVFVAIVVFFIRRRSQKKVPPPGDLEGFGMKVDWRRISYLELKRGTSSFDEKNLVGRGSFGSVFKGILPDGLNVAVKVFNVDKEQSSKSFDTESEILSSLRHRNLVRIIGCCVNTEFKALILEYMSNGNLEKWLHSESYSLDLVQSLDVAIDVALALEYLHHGHTYTVVHCDIKPSNVLLDQHMIARVGDFGISKLFDEGEVSVITKTLATIGYAAPEYGSEGKVSTNGDVYSYGILLLEMFTRKKPTDDMFSGEMSLKEWVEKAVQESAVGEIVASVLVSSDDRDFDSKKKCVSSIFDLAMQCVAFSPEERINMIEVVASLHKIKSKVAVEGPNGMHNRSPCTDRAWECAIARTVQKRKIMNKIWRKMGRTWSSSSTDRARECH